jgi:hypothetical protein
MRFRRNRRGPGFGRALAVFVAAACVAVGAASATSGLITATVAPGQTVAQLRYQLFEQKVRCTQWCDATTVVTISIDDARRLGYTGSAPSNGRVMVASNFTRIKPGASTATRFVVTAQGKKLLAKAKRGLHVSGLVTAFPRGKPKLVANVRWATVLH